MQSFRMSTGWPGAVSPRVAGSYGRGQNSMPDGGTALITLGCERRPLDRVWHQPAGGSVCEPLEGERYCGLFDALVRRRPPTMLASLPPTAAANRLVSPSLSRKSRTVCAPAGVRSAHEDVIPNDLH